MPARASSFIERIVPVLLLSVVLLSCMALIARSETEIVQKIEHRELEAELHKIGGPVGEEIRYGYDLIVNTPYYFGPKGKVLADANVRTSCGNCHMDAGTRPFGNSFLDTHSLYPQFRGREGKIQTLAERVNTCLHYTIHARPIPESSREMKAILLYMKWVGRNRVAPEKDRDDRLATIKFLDRAADPSVGKQVYGAKCARCHGPNGEGRFAQGKDSYLYPPLWGKDSYVFGSSMSRLSVLARFVKTNMPYGVVASQPELSDEQAWDVAAYVNSQPRRKAKETNIFPSLADKPFDYPIPPYQDSFKHEQHLFGPFGPILEYRKARTNPSDTGSGLGI